MSPPHALVAALMLLALMGGMASAKVQVLDESNFDTVIDGTKPALVEFFAPWCGHCKKLAPEYEILGETFDRHSASVVIASVDCDAHKDLCARFGVTGYPSLKWFIAGSSTPISYSGGRTADDLITYVNQQTGLSAKQPSAPPSLVEILDESNFEEVAKGADAYTFVEFFAPWCGHCKRLAPIWEKLAAVFQNEPTVRIASVDADEHKILGGREGVSGYPTLKFYTNGEGEKYEGGRTLEDLVGFINEKAGTHRLANGRLNESAGLIDSLDEHIDTIYAGGKKTDDIEAAIAAAEAMDSKIALVYKRGFTKLLDGDEAYFAREISRLERMMVGDNITPMKKDEFTKRVNVLHQFHD